MICPSFGRSRGRQEVQGGRVFFGCCDGSYDPDRLGDTKAKNLDFWKGTRKRGHASGWRKKRDQS